MNKIINKLIMTLQIGAIMSVFLMPTIILINMLKPKEFFHDLDNNVYKNIHRQAQIEKNGICGFDESKNIDCIFSEEYKNINGYR